LRIDYLHFLHAGEDRRGGRLDALVELVVHAGLHVVGGHGLAVVELHSLAQLEVDGLVVDHVPGGGEAGHGLSGEVTLDQRVKEIHAHGDADQLTGEERVGALDFADRVHTQRAGQRGRGRGGGRRGRSGRGRRRSGGGRAGGGGRWLRGGGWSGGG